MVVDICPPCYANTSGIKRIEGFLRYLPEFGWRTLVLTHACRCAEKGALERGEIWLPLEFPPSRRVFEYINKRLDQWSDASPMIIRIPCTPNWLLKMWCYLVEMTTNPSDEPLPFHYVFPFAPKVPLLPSPLKGLALLLRKIISFVLDLSWLGNLDFLKRGSIIAEFLGAFRRMDVIFSSHPYSVPHAIAHRTSKRTGIPWIAEMRDSIWRKGGSLWRKSFTLFRLKFLKNAKAIIYVTPQEAERDKWWLKRKGFIIENGFLEEEVKEARLSVGEHFEFFVIRFLGSVYPRRQDLDLFFKGLKHFLNSSQYLEKSWFEYYGGSWYEVKKAARKLGILNFCKIHPRVSPDKALRLTASATVLVLPMNTLGQSGIPGGKFYEYLGVRRPILAVGGRDEYVEEVLKRTGAGLACHTPEEVAAVLRMWYEEWRRMGDVKLCYNETEIAKFSRRYGAKKLATIFDAIIKGENITPEEII